MCPIAGGKGTKAAKLRPHNPLGRLAVIMQDSRGMETSDSSKGFINVFVQVCQ